MGLNEVQLSRIPKYTKISVLSYTISLFTVFGNAMQTNVQRKFAHQGAKVWKCANCPFRAFSSSFWNAKEC